MNNSKAKEIVVKRGAPNWPAQVKVKKSTTLSSSHKKRTAYITKVPQQIHWVERAAAEVARGVSESKASARYLGHGRAAEAEQIRNDLSRPAIRGFVMRQCKICKVLFEGYHNCTSDEWQLEESNIGDDSEGPAWFMDSTSGLSAAGPHYRHPIVTYSATTTEQHKTSARDS
jgi:hypothetical protein